MGCHITYYLDKDKDVLPEPFPHTGNDGVTDALRNELENAHLLYKVARSMRSCMVYIPFAVVSSSWLCYGRRAAFIYPLARVHIALSGPRALVHHDVVW